MEVGMKQDPQQCEENVNKEEKLLDRRQFLLGLRKWSMIVIGGAVAGSELIGSDQEANAAAWANRGGGGGGAWANRAGGGGAWANKAGGGGGAWANRAGGGGAWANRGAAWANRGSAWVNRF
jgi:hypothetical protein